MTSTEFRRNLFARIWSSAGWPARQGAAMARRALSFSPISRL